MANLEWPTLKESKTLLFLCIAYLDYQNILNGLHTWSTFVAAVLIPWIRPCLKSAPHWASNVGASLRAGGFLQGRSQV